MSFQLSRGIEQVVQAHSAGASVSIIGPARPINGWLCRISNLSDAGDGGGQSESLPASGGRVSIYFLLQNFNVNRSLLLKIFFFVLASGSRLPAALPLESVREARKGRSPAWEGEAPAEHSHIPKRDNVL